MVIVVLNLATGDDVAAEAWLRRAGYAKREVWVRETTKESAAYDEADMRNLGVGRFMVGDTWGRGAD